MTISHGEHRERFIKKKGQVQKQSTNFRGVHALDNKCVLVQNARFDKCKKMCQVN